MFCHCAGVSNRFVDHDMIVQFCSGGVSHKSM
jgi:hypothetical protein